MMKKQNISISSIKKNKTISDFFEGIENKMFNNNQTHKDGKHAIIGSREEYENGMMRESKQIIKLRKRPQRNSNTCTLKKHLRNI